MSHIWVAFSQANSEPTEEASLTPAPVGFVVAPEILAIEGDVEWGEYLASECTTCHQASGATDGIPSIVGLDADAFVTMMHEYREKYRENPVMQLVAGRLSDDEIAGLAAYFEGL